MIICGVAKFVLSFWMQASANHSHKNGKDYNTKFQLSLEEASNDLGIIYDKAQSELIEKSKFQCKHLNI